MLKVTSDELTEILNTGKLKRPDREYDFVKTSRYYGESKTIVLDNIELTEGFSFRFLPKRHFPVTIYNLVSQYSFALHGSLTGNIRIYGGSFRSLYISVTVEEHIWLLGGSAQTVEISSNEVQSIEIDDFKASTFIFSAVTCDALKISGGTIDVMRTAGPQNHFKIIRFFGGDIKTFLIAFGQIDCLLIRRNIPSSNSISLENVRVNRLEITGTTNYGKLYINQLEPIGDNPTVDIDGSIIGAMDVISTDLSKFNVFVQNSKLVDIFYADTSFPDRVHVKEGTETAKIRELAGIYEQLSIVSAKRGDKYNTVRFQALSLGYLLKTLPRFSIDWWMLSIYKVSNNFRLNWLRGVVFTLAVSLLFYVPFVLLIENQIEWGLYGWQKTWDAFTYVFDYRTAQFFEFLNPLHKIDYFVKEGQRVGFWAYLVDYIGRIFVGFGIYQTIQAFRKYGKSGD